MYYSSPANLAIVTCPGGETFSDQVIIHLKNHYRHIFKNTVDDMSRLFSMEPDEVMRRINFINEITTSGMNPRSHDMKLHAPNFKVPTRFTMFPNGELKAEILKSIRGKNIFIVQDVENRYPVKFNDGAVTKGLSVNDHLMMIYVTIDERFKSRSPSLC